MMIEVAKIPFTATKKTFNTTVKRNVLQISGMGFTNTCATDTKGKCYKVAWFEWASPREKFCILKPFSKSRSYEDRSLHRTTRHPKLEISKS
jgi:hypothetical protein